MKKLFTQSVFSTISVGTLKVLFFILFFLPNTRCFSQLTLPYYEYFNGSSGFTNQGIASNTIVWEEDTIAHITALQGQSNQVQRYYSPPLNTTSITDPGLQFDIYIKSYEASCVPVFKLSFQVDGDPTRYSLGTISPSGPCNSQDVTLPESSWETIALSSVVIHPSVQFILEADFIGLGQIRVDDFFVDTKDSLPYYLPEPEPEPTALFGLSIDEGGIAYSNEHLWINSSLVQQDLVILNVLGQTCYTQQAVNSQVDISVLPKGMYWAILEEKNTPVAYRKFVK